MLVEFVIETLPEDVSSENTESTATESASTGETPAAPVTSLGTTQFEYFCGEVLKDVRWRCEMFGDIQI